MLCQGGGFALSPIALHSLFAPFPFQRWYTERTRELIKWNTGRRQGKKQGAALFLLAESGDCGLIELVLRLHNAVVIATAKEPVGHQGFDLQEKEIVIKRKEAIGAGFLYAIAHNTFVGSKDKEVVEQAEGVAMGKKSIEIGDVGVGTVFVGPDLGELVEETFAPTGLVESGGGGCVHGDEDVGHDATTAIHGTPTRSLIPERVGEMDRVGAEQFAMLIASTHVVVVFVAAFGVGALNATARGCEIACRGKAYLPAVSEGEHSLYQSFAIAPSAYDGATVPVLHGTTYNFGGRCRLFINQYHQASFVEGAPAVSQEVLTGTGAPFLIYNEFAVGKKLIGQTAGDVEVAATIATEVENE